MRLARTTASRRILRNASLVALAVAAAVVAALAVRTPDPPQAAESTSPRLLLMTGGTLTEGMARTLSRELRWSAQIEVHNGAGFSRVVRRGDKPLAPALRDRGITDTTDVLAVQGGEVDVSASDEAITTGVVHLLDYILAFKRPDAVAVLIGPIPRGAQATAAYRRVSGVMRSAAVGRGVPFVDPVAQGWRIDDELLISRLAAALIAARLGRGVESPPVSESPGELATPTLGISPQPSG